MGRLVVHKKHNVFLEKQVIKQCCRYAKENVKQHFTITGGAYGNSSVFLTKYKLANPKLITYEIQIKIMRYKISHYKIFLYFDNCDK